MIIIFRFLRKKYVVGKCTKALKIDRLSNRKNPNFVLFLWVIFCVLFIMSHYTNNKKSLCNTDRERIYAMHQGTIVEVIFSIELLKYEHEIDLYFY